MSDAPTTRPPEDALPNPEPAPPSLDQPDPAVFHPNTTKGTETAE